MLFVFFKFILYFYYWYFIHFGTRYCFTLKVCSDICDRFIGPN